MRILVLTEGGRGIGFGHLSRCMSLTQGITRFNKAEVSFVINGDKIARDFLKEQGVMSITMSNWIKEKNKIRNMAKNSDMVIIDSYLAPKVLYDFIYRAIRRPNSRLLCMDDHNRIDYPASVLLNPCIYGNKLGYNRNTKSLYLLGRDYTLLRKEFWRVPAKRIRKDIKDVLVTFGGGGGHTTCVKRLIRFLSKKYPEFKYHFVSPGPNLSARDMVKLMLKCDICISAGGQTLYELARVGLPTIGICFADNQVLNLKEWSRMGFLKFIGWIGDEKLFKKIKKILNILDCDSRIKMSNKGRSLVDGKGVERVIKEVLKWN